MNKKIVLSALSIVALSTSMAFALTAPRGGVAGSIHDMNQYPGATKDSQGRVCAFCHTPHHAATDGNDYLPLWSHVLPTTSYVPYNTATIDATIDPSTMMEGPSKLCMSCHDGAIAVDTHYSTTDNGSKHLSGDSFGNAALAENASLSNDHPIGFVFDAVAAGNPDTGAPGTSTEKGKDNYIKTSGAKYDGNLDTTMTVASRLYNGSQGAIMTCATCHDVHNKKNADDPTKTNYLLLAPNTDSKLCLSCHIK
ncbi:cytochrome C [Geomonas edaphica]|uniref:cytochrome C n=1 Tax=Geomonas edaphica TaxID=2570226 RepID=UPI0010A787BA|nr:cytochrome C [Geomonas edaphica]